MRLHLWQTTCLDPIWLADNLIRYVVTPSTSSGQASQKTLLAMTQLSFLVAASAGSPSAARRFRYAPFGRTQPTLGVYFDYAQYRSKPNAVGLLSMTKK